MQENQKIENIIRQRLIESIKQSGMSNTAIAKLANIHVSMITDYKNTSKLPSLATFADLCRILDVSADYILGLTERL